MASGEHERMLAMLRAQSLLSDAEARRVADSYRQAPAPVDLPPDMSPDVRRLEEQHLKQERALQAIVAMLDQMEQRITALETQLDLMAEQARQKLNEAA
jgi:hypothetical protein